MAVINAVAEFERDLLIERTQAGLSGLGRKAGARPAGQSHGRAARGGRAPARGGCERVGPGADLQDQSADDLADQGCIGAS